MYERTHEDVCRLPVYLGRCVPGSVTRKTLIGNPPRVFRGNLQKKSQICKIHLVCISAYANVYFKTILRPGSAFEPGYLRVSPVLHLHLCAFRLCSVIAILLPAAGIEPTSVPKNLLTTEALYHSATEVLIELLKYLSNSISTSVAEWYKASVVRRFFGYRDVG